MDNADKIKKMNIMKTEDSTGFGNLLKRSLKQKSGSKIEWDKIESPSNIFKYEDLLKTGDTSVLNKLAILKLNGGLGTSMGCTGPKSVIEVQGNKTFLDLIVEQVDDLNKTYGVDVPLCLMNSFNTHEETDKIISKYKSSSVTFHTFMQSCYPRLLKETMLPIASKSYTDDTKDHWYPPGHGDVYQALWKCGLLDTLLEEGKEYIFISNVDNLGAIVDIDILSHLIRENCDFAMEVTNKTLADVKGGTLIKYGDSTTLLEIAQVEAKHISEFKSIKKFKIFNTNNLWVGLESMKELVESNSIQSPIIFNNKKVEDQAVIQLETACGAAISSFHRSIGINVPRSRFLPVKATNDLFLVQSDLFTVINGSMIRNEKRISPVLPMVKLGSYFKLVSGFNARICGNVPTLIDLENLIVSGDVHFGRDIVLQGTVVIVCPATGEGPLRIPDGTLLNNQIVTFSGDLNIQDL